MVGSKLTSPKVNRTFLQASPAGAFPCSTRRETDLPTRECGHVRVLATTGVHTVGTEDDSPQPNLTWLACSLEKKVEQIDGVGGGGVKINDFVCLPRFAEAKSPR